MSGIAGREPFCVSLIATLLGTGNDEGGSCVAATARLVPSTTPGSDISLELFEDPSEGTIEGGTQWHTDW